ncbi:MAG: thioredoxin [Desulfobaccales bacterium]
MLEWLKSNVVTVALLLLAAWVLAGRFGWFQAPIKDDPTSPIRHFSSATWESEVLAVKQPVLVDFWAPWCPPCRSQGPIVSDLAKQVSATAIVGKLDVDKNQDVAARYGISGIPALLIFRHGQVVRSFTGLTSGETLRQALEAAAH